MKLTPIRILTAASLGAMALFFTVLPLLAVDVDRHALEREVKFVSAGISQAMSGLTNRTASAANWDEALRNTDQFSPAWAQVELTAATDGDPFNRVVLVLDHQNDVLFQREHARPMSPSRAASFALATSAMAAKLRLRELSRPIRDGIPVPRDSSTWPSETATIEVLGRPYFMVACLIGTDIGHVRLTHDHAPILILGSDVAASLVPQIDPGLLLEGAALTGAVPALPGMASVPFTDLQGRTIARFVWHPNQPGAALLRSATLPLAAPILAMLATILAASLLGARSARLLSASEKRAQHLASHDHLTGLGNRRALMDQLGRALKQPGAKLALLLIDLDRFKHVNDSFGHHAGDELIRAVGHRLVGLLRAGDRCNRLGGDEFVILAADMTELGAGALAGRIAQALAPPVALSACTVHVAGSIGISLNEPGDTEAELLRRADLALYQAKDAGRGTFRIHDAEMDRAHDARRQIEADLREALALGHIEVAYQPQMEGDRLAGVEALARWTHPKRGTIAPGMFVPVAEESGLIHALGLAVMRRAFTDSRRWPGIFVAINVSARQLRLPDFLPDLRALVAEMQVDPHRFELELTESLLLVDDMQIHTSLTAIRAMGFGLAIDDFGTGFSSLSYLTRFPITRIKIDRSFVSGLSSDLQSEAIVRAIIRLAAALGLEVIAEGVETTEQRDRLTALGCTQIQGYLTGRPVQADQIGHPLLQRTG